jgi:hypothetical protein
MERASRAAGAAEKLSRTLYFCPSPLYGYGLAGLLEQISPDSAVLCVETDEKLFSLSLDAMKGLLDHPRLRLVRTGDPSALCGYVREAWGSRSFRRVKTLRLSGGWQLSPELYETLAAALRREIAVEWGNAMTLVKLGRRYIRNALRNLALIPRARTIAGLDFGNTPALVLGAGPSLDAALDGLGSLEAPRRPFKIICVDTVLPVLWSRNIKPDLAVALESQHWNLRDFIGLGNWEIPVAMDLSALPATGEALGLPFLFVTPWTPLRLFDRLGAAGLLPETFPPLGSVGLTAAALALRICSGPVITGGIDFSFTLDSFHGRATPGHQERLRRQTRFISLINGDAAFRRGVFETRSKSGGKVRSDPAMKNYRDLFEQEFAREGRLRDMAGSGLPLGIKTVEAEEARQLLRGGTPAGGTTETGPDAPAGGAVQKLTALIEEERGLLIQLRSILTGTAPANPGRLETLLDEADYLWAHFPECAGAGGRRPPETDLSFLKRVRTEIDPFIELWELTLREIHTPVTSAP